VQLVTTLLARLFSINQCHGLKPFFPKNLVIGVLPKLLPNRIDFRRYQSQVAFRTCSILRDSEGGTETEQEIAYLKEYTVFCADQYEGLPAHYYEIAEAPKEQLARSERAEAFFANTKADIRYGGNRAFYAIDADYALSSRCKTASAGHAAIRFVNHAKLMSFEPVGTNHADHYLQSSCWRIRYEMPHDCDLKKCWSR
jgi:hypothetical protein